VSIYISWSYPAEAGRNPAELDNRFSTMTEVRRVAWPDYEAPEWSDPQQFQQGIAGSLELFFWAFAPFQEFVGEITGHVVPVFQRIDQAGFKLPIDGRVLADTDTLLVFGLDTMVTDQNAASEEIEALKKKEASGSYLVQVAHFATAEEAVAMLQKLIKEGYDGTVLSQSEQGGTTHWVQLGPYANESKAQSVARDVNATLGLQSLVVVEP